MYLNCLSEVTSSRFFFCIIFLFYIQPLLFAADNTLYHFGPQSDTVLVFAASAANKDEESSAIHTLKQYANHLQQHAPDIHIIVAITKHDITTLPADIPVRRLQGTKELIQTILAYPNPIVCLIDTGESTSTKIIAGAKGITTPAWLLEAVYNTLANEHFSIDFYSNTILLHRLGWLDNDPILQLYNEAHIPAIKIETNADLSKFLYHFPQILQKNKNNEWDMHYLVYKIGKKIFIIGENKIINILSFSTMIILFWLIVLSFLFGKKQAQHIKDLFILWWMPLYFFCINSAGFMLGTKITEYLFYIRLSSLAEIQLFALPAMALKYSFALFFIFLFTSLNIIIPLPQNRFIYGFMANIACLINIFIFSSIHFSFSFIFLLIYVISLIAYQCKNTIIQTCFIFGLFVPLIPLVTYFFHAQQKIFNNIFSTNLEIALIFVPVDLLLIRLSLSISKKQKGIISPFRIPIHCKCMGILFSIFALWIFFLPIERTKEKEPFTLMQKIEKDTTIFLKKYHSTYMETTILPDELIYKESISKSEANNLLSIKSSLYNYLERSTGSITIHSSLKPEALFVTITAQPGSAFYDADITFERNSKGDTVYFSSVPQPILPFTIRFSASKNAILDVKVQMWSMENPYGATINEPSSGSHNNSFLLEIKKDFSIIAQIDKNE